MKHSCLIEVCFSDESAKEEFKKAWEKSPSVRWRFLQVDSPPPVGISALESVGINRVWSLKDDGGS